METTLQQRKPVRFVALAARDVADSRPHLDSGPGGIAQTASFLWLGLATIGLSSWSIVARDERSVVAALIGLTIASAFGWTQAIRSSGKPNGTAGVRLDVFALVGVGALALASTLAGTISSPFILLVPLSVGLASSRISDDRLLKFNLVLGLAGLAGVGIRAYFANDMIDATTVMFLLSLGLLTLFAAFATSSLAVEIRSRNSSNKHRDYAATLSADQIDRLRNADNPIGVAKASADILEQGAAPSYLAIVEQIPDTKILRPLVERGTLEIDIDRIRTGLASLSHEAISETEARILVNDGRDLDSIVCRRLGVEAVLIVPLRRMGYALGAIHLAWSDIEQAQSLTDARDLALSLSQWITPDIAISRVASDLERGYINAIVAVSASLDERSKFTTGHSRRVARTALEIAELLSLADHEQRQLLYAAEMHDLGWVGVDHELLAKPSALSDEDWSSVQTVPARGAGIVDPVSYFGDASEAIRHLRERWDGGGYPDGLQGANIPLLARIVAVAEAYDSMMSIRPYRDAMSSEDALRQLWHERGAKFDPEIVEMFVRSRAPSGAEALHQ